MALSTEQKINLLFKFLQGFEESNVGKLYFEESFIDNSIWTQVNSIPVTAPVLNDGQSNGVVTRRIDLPLTQVPGNPNAFYNEYLSDAIHYKFGDGSYDWDIKDDLGNTIYKGQYENLKSAKSRILYFYNGAPANMPPKMSFYQYTGTKNNFGESSGASGDADNKYRGGFDVSLGTLPTNGSGSGGEIKKGDFWRVSVTGILVGLPVEEVLNIGDLLYAGIDSADEVDEFFGVSRNIALSDYVLTSSSLMPQNQQQADALHNAEQPSDVNPLITLSALNTAIFGLGQFAGNYDASGGLLPTNGTGVGGVIVKGDFWRVSTGGTITGLEPDEVVGSGDVIYANANDATLASQFFMTVGNPDFDSKADKTDTRFPTINEKNSLTAANNPSVTNPVATMADITDIGADYVEYEIVNFTTGFIVINPKTEESFRIYYRANRGIEYTSGILQVDVTVDGLSVEFIDFIGDIEGIGFTAFDFVINGNNIELQYTLNNAGDNVFFNILKGDAASIKDESLINVVNFDNDVPGAVVIGTTANTRIKIELTVNRNSLAYGQDIDVVYDGTNVHIGKGNIVPYIASAPTLGLTFTAAINGSDIELEYDVTGNIGAGLIKFNKKTL